MEGLYLRRLLIAIESNLIRQTAVLELKANGYNTYILIRAISPFLDMDS